MCLECLKFNYDLESDRISREMIQRSSQFVYDDAIPEINPDLLIDMPVRRNAMDITRDTDQT